MASSTAEKSPSSSVSRSSSATVYLQNMDQVRKVFERFDADGDGKISSQELIEVLKALQGSDSAVTTSSPEEVEKMMDAIETKENGLINLEEFAAFLCSADEEKELREAFELYDQDHDGKISAGELHLILTRIGETCTVQDCTGMIQSVDSSGDGYVSFEEFRKMMTTNKKK